VSSKQLWLGIVTWFGAMRTRLHRLWSGAVWRVVGAHGAWLLALIGVVSCVLAVLVLSPGYMSTDSADQLDQARSLDLIDHHPIVMSLIWRCLDQVVPGPFGMLVLNNVLYWFGLTAIFTTLRWPLWLRALAIPAVGFFPPVFCIMGAIWKDTLMQAALVAAVGSFLILERKKSWLLLALGILCWALAAGVRHNGVAAAWPLLALPLVNAQPLAKLSARARLVACVTAALVSAMVLSFTLMRASASLARKASFWQMIATFDIAGVSIGTGKMMFDADSPVLRPGTTVRDLRRAFRIQNHMTLYKCPMRRCKAPVFRVYEEPELARLASNWRHVILSEPSAYLRHRMALYRYVSGIDGGAAKLRYGSKTKYRRTYPLSRRARETLRQLASLAHTAWFKVWIYLALSALAAPISAVLALRGRSLLPLVFVLSGTSYAATLFLAAGAPDYRYSVWSVLASVLALLTLAQPHLFRSRDSEGNRPSLEPLREVKTD
jgi:hypothetical protein